MEPGHPFLTEALDDLRAAHRRILWSIPSWLFDDNALGLPRPLPQTLAVTRHALETYIRTELIPASIERSRRIIGHWADSRLAEELKAVADAISEERPHRYAALQPTLAAIEQHTTANPHVNMPPEMQPDATALLALLVWADQLADDGYADPRLAVLAQD